MAAHPQILTQEFLLECFEYKAESGDLVWKVRPSAHFKNSRCCKTWNAKNPGRKACSQDAKGYLKVKVNSSSYKVHRIIWKMETGRWPDQIDHINGRTTDNRLSNLREVTNVENSRNASLSKANTSGVVGVNWVKSRGKWKASIKVDGKRSHLGYFANKRDAIASRKSAESKYGFHKNHGRAKVKQ